MQRKEKILLLFLIILGLFFYVILSQQYFDSSINPMGIGSDGGEYWDLSESLLKHKKFSYSSLKYYYLLDRDVLADKDYYNQPISSISRLPGYPIVLAFLRFFHNNIFVAYVLNYVAYLGVIVYGIFFGYLFLFQKKGVFWLFTVSLIFSPIYFVWTGVQSDIFASFMIMGFTVHILLIKRTITGRGNIFWAIVYGALAVMTRPNLFPVVFLLSTVPLLINPVKKSLWKLNAIVLGCLLLVMCGWMCRNYRLTGNLVFSTQGGKALFLNYVYYDIDQSHPLAPWKGPARPQFIDQRINKGLNFNQAEVQLNNKLKALTLEYLRNHPEEIIPRMWRAYKAFFNNSYYDITDVIILRNADWSVKKFYLKQGKPIYEDQAVKKSREIAYQFSRGYKILLTASFTFFPILLIYGFYKGKNDFPWKDIFGVYLSFGICLFLTAVLTSHASGDRIRMPFHVFNNFLLWIWFYYIMKSSHFLRGRAALDY
ncbi:MAG: hypothetical protein H6755_08000 [Candidatus Omnitrophica bacterium]|nr:hypothetical protein [Candidatus Omnitrophota bacterium]MCB9748335.1 hypothetical protein [Candidatus Omnitrophota bacterium]